LILPVNKEEYDKAVSKFITIPEGLTEVYLNVEVGMPDWDTPDVSVKFPVRVTDEGVDFNKEDKISAGVGKTAIWKLKTILTNLNVPVTVKAGGKVAFDPASCAGAPAVGHWVKTKGRKGGDPDAPETVYSKLMDLLPAGTSTSVEEGLL